MLIVSGLRQLALDESHHTPHHGFHRERANRHLRQLILDGAELGDRRSECFAFGGVFQADGKHVFCSTHGTRAEFQPADVQDIKRDDVPAPNFAKQVFDRNPDVVKIHRRGRTALDAHFVFFGAAGHAGKAALHQERRELLAAYFSEYGKEVCRASVGDPHLLSVEDVVFAVCAEIRPGTHGESIGAGQRFG